MAGSGDRSLLITCATLLTVYCSLIINLTEGKPQYTTSLDAVAPVLRKYGIALKPGHYHPPEGQLYHIPNKECAEDEVLVHDECKKKKKKGDTDKEYSADIYIVCPYGSTYRNGNCVPKNIWQSAYYPDQPYQQHYQQPYQQMYQDVIQQQPYQEVYSQGYPQPNSLLLPQSYGQAIFSGHSVAHPYYVQPNAQPTYASGTQVLYRK